MVHQLYYKLLWKRGGQELEDLYLQDLFSEGLNDYAEGGIFTSGDEFGMFVASNHLGPATLLFNRRRLIWRVEQAPPSKSEWPLKRG